MKSVIVSLVLLVSAIACVKIHALKEQQEIVSKTSRSTVRLFLGLDKVVGTGFAVDCLKSKAILTNAHVCNNYQQANIAPLINEIGSPVSYDAPTLLVSTKYDLCLIPLKRSSIPVLSITRDARIEPHTPVITYGAPHGGELTPRVGYTLPTMDNSLGIRLSVPTVPGNSGSPVVNAYTGEVIGIIYAYNDLTYNGYMIPSVDILDFLGKVCTPSNADIAD